jgi:dTDP-4-amino-4,6-dideoxygalactose transaminase
MPVRSRENFLVFGSPKIEESEILEVEAVMRSGWLGTGPRVARFEHEFGRYRGAPHAVAEFLLGGPPSFAVGLRRRPG